MPAVMNRYMQRLRSVKFARNVTHVDAPLSLSAIQANGQVTITALELCGVEYHSAQDVNYAVNEDVSVMAVLAPTPGKIVLWCTEIGRNRKGNSTSSAPLPSYNMTEESMDDEGNVVTWSCVWPDEASAVDVPFSVSYRDDQKSDITVHVGVQRIDGRQEIEPLGYAIISLPEPDLSELNEQRPQQSVSLQSVSLEPPKLKKQISSRFGARNKKKPPSNECSISPSTELKLELKVAWENTPSATTASSTMFEDTELMKECRSVDTNSTSHSATSTQARMDYELKLEKHLGVDNPVSSNDSHTGSRRTVRATNTTTTPVPINNEPDGYSIQSEHSVLDGAVTKEYEVVDVAPLGQELLDKTQLCDIVHTVGDDTPADVLENVGPLTGDGIINNDMCMAEEQPGQQPRYSVGELNTGAGALGDIPEDETLLTVELERTDSDLSTLDLSKSEFPEQQEKKNPHTPIVLFGLRCHELTSCKTQAEEIWDDAVEGFNDIVSCGVFIEDIFGDDATCQTDCTSSVGTYEDSTLSSYPSTVCTAVEKQGHLIKPSWRTWRLGTNAKEETQTAGTNIDEFPMKKSISSISAKTASSWRAPPPSEKSVPKERYECDESTSITSTTKTKRGKYTNLDELPMKKSISSISAKSASSGRAPTPSEKSVLKERYECDASVSVYSL